MDWTRLFLVIDRGLSNYYHISNCLPPPTADRTMVSQLVRGGAAIRSAFEVRRAIPIPLPCTPVVRNTAGVLWPGKQVRVEAAGINLCLSARRQWRICLMYVYTAEIIARGKDIVETPTSGDRPFSFAERSNMTWFVQCSRYIANLLRQQLLRNLSCKRHILTGLYS